MTGTVSIYQMITTLSLGRTTMTSSPCLYTPSPILYDQDISNYYKNDGNITIVLMNLQLRLLNELYIEYKCQELVKNKFKLILLIDQIRMQALQQFQGQSIMNRKPVFYSNKHDTKNFIDLSPRMVVKRPQALRHGAVLAQGSAQMRRKKPDAKVVRLQSPLYSRPNPQLRKIDDQKQFLSEQQIRSSALYKRLQHEIKELMRRQEQQIQKLKKLRQQKRKESEIIKKQQFATKLQIWELKNEVFDIKQLIQEQRNESERLLQQIRPLGAIRNQNGQTQQQQARDLTQNQQQSYQTEEQS